MFKGLIEILYFVPDRRAASDWYARHFGVEITQLEEAEWYFIRIGNQEVLFHVVDEKVPEGIAGQVDDFEAALTHAQALGGQLYRGPLNRLDGTFMCQVKDPFGNAFGMIGPRDG